VLKKAVRDSRGRLFSAGCLDKECALAQRWCRATHPKVCRINEGEDLQEENEQTGERFRDQMIDHAVRG
jgi:hypothetical protein